MYYTFTYLYFYVFYAIVIRVLLDTYIYGLDMLVYILYIIYGTHTNLEVSPPCIPRVLIIKKFQNPPIHALL